MYLALPPLAAPQSAFVLRVRTAAAPFAGLSGFGAACTPILSTTDIYNLALGAGFPPSTAQTMTAVALRESAGCPNAHNPGPGEDSYGLWQINIQGNPGLMPALGLTDPTQLYDPATNAAAAAWLWGGNDANLAIAWRTDQPNYGTPGYTLADYLPGVQAALANLSAGVTDLFSGSSAAGAGFDLSAAGPTIAAAALALGALWVLSD